MDVILKVIDGAKKGAKIAVKKSEFLIGRSRDCHLCVGSTAISRKHCRLLKRDAAVTAQDLGSRNGTHVNGKKIDAEVELKSGDELTVGPLKFQIRISTGIRNEKKSQVTSVAEAADRAADIAMGDVPEDDISKWLIDSGRAPPTSETKTFVLDETSAASLAQAASENDASAAPVPVKSSSDQGEQPESPKVEERVDPKSDAKGSGKLPFRPAESSSKDSREAAVEALRAFNRRR